MATTSTLGTRIAPGGEPTGDGTTSRSERRKRFSRSILNALGDCHQRLGDAAKVKEAFERSLGLDPDQDTVKELLESLGGQP